MKNFDISAIKLEGRMRGQEVEYQRKMKAQFWKDIYDFTRSRMWNRRIDAIIVRKFGDNGISQKHDAFNNRIVFATINRVKKSRAFAQNVGKGKSLIFLSVLCRKLGIWG